MSTINNYALKALKSNDIELIALNKILTNHNGDCTQVKITSMRLNPVQLLAVRQLFATYYPTQDTRVSVEKNAEVLFQVFV